MCVCVCVCVGRERFEIDRGCERKQSNERQQACEMTHFYVPVCLSFLREGEREKEDWHFGFGGFRRAME